MKIQFRWFRNGEWHSSRDYSYDNFRLIPRMGDTITVEGFQGIVTDVCYNWPPEGFITVTLN